MLANTPAWLASRVDYLGASEVAAAMGLDAWRSPEEVAASKRGAPGWSGNRATRRGHWLEGFVLGEYARERGYGLEQLGEVVVHPRVPRLRSSLDAVATRWPDHRRIVDAKTSTTDHLGEWEEWRELAPRGQVPWGTCCGAYHVQAQAQMACLGMERADFVCLIQNDLIVVEVRRDQAFVDVLESWVGPWWERHVVAGEPAETGRGLEAERLAAAREDVLELEPDAAVLATIETYRAAKAAVKAAEVEETRIKGELTTVLWTLARTLRPEEDPTQQRAPDAVRCGGVSLIRTRGRKRFDVEALKADHPELVERYQARGAGYYQLRETKG